MMSCAGNEDLSTPNMDSLAAEGVRFNNAYCTFPLCTPSRASIVSGRYPHELGIKWNGYGFKEEDCSKGIGNLLSSSGYECAYGGKWHIPYLAMPEDNQHGFETICGFDDLKLPSACSEFITRKHDKPWFLVAGFDNPHNICEAARNQWLPWGPVPEAIPEQYPNLPANHSPGSYFPEALTREQKACQRVYAAQDYSEDQWRRLRHIYARLTEKVDKGLGVILDALRKSGQYDNTIIIYTSDHGDACGAHRWNQKTALFEETAKIPLIIQAPEGAKGSVSNRLVSNGLDLYDTILDYAGVDKPAKSEGDSLRPLIEERTINWREHLVVETFFGADAELKTSGRMVRTERFKYVVYDSGRNREQLFDLQKDPGEMVNLAVESRYHDELVRHRDLLYSWCVRTGDTYHSRRSGVGVPGHEYDHFDESLPRVNRPYTG